MKQSQLFTKTRKEAPKDEVSKNAQLLIKAGFVHKEMAGVYTYLPLGLRVLNKINDIIRDEMNKVGGVEMKMTALQDKAVWEKTDRWDDAVVDNWFKTELKNGTQLGLGFTHEEPITNMLTNFVSSYKDLPFYPYQIQTKFRNETRAKSGIMRGREFLMKDLYSFSKNKEEHDVFYERMKEAYTNVFERAGLGDKTYMTFASGGSFSKYSHEYQTLTDAGEDIIYICEKCHIAVNQEIIEDQKVCPMCQNDDLKTDKAAEVGNIFSLGTKFSDALGLRYKNEVGEEVPVVMGSYGIGPGRLMGTIVELFADGKGLVWPAAIAPFKVHIVSIGEDAQAEDLYNQLLEEGIDALFDDRDVRPGEKLADADLIGIPYRIVVSSKSLEAGGVEMKKRDDTESEVLPFRDTIARVKH